MNISINILGHEGKKSWDGDELVETIQRWMGISDEVTRLEVQGMDIRNEQTWYVLGT